MSSNQDSSSTLPSSSVIFYLLLVPLFFAGSLHYMESKNKSQVYSIDVKVNTDITTLKYLLHDSQETRKCLPFYSQDAVYTPVSPSVDLFNYSLPLLGLREIRIIKGKEENIFKSPEESLYSVGNDDPGYVFARY